VNGTQSRYQLNTNQIVGLCFTSVQLFERSPAVLHKQFNFKMMSQTMFSSLVLMAAILLLVPGCTALQCYQCGVESSQSCKSFDRSRVFRVDCPSLSSFGQTLEQFCYRSSAIAPLTHGDNRGCITLLRGMGGCYNATCFCNTDFCNAANSLHRSIVLFILALVAGSYKL